jgi:16S rRNA (guanine527-N7)-methyltransferase
VTETDLRNLGDFSRSAFGLDLDRDALERIGRFVELLEVWNRSLRLTGERDPEVLLGKHAADSLACAALPAPGTRVLDIGTGAGFPGAIIGCARPDVAVTLLDSRERPISFLSEAIRSVPLPYTRAVLMRAEEAAGDPSMAGAFDLITSRAVRLDQFLGLAAPLVAPGGRIVSMQATSTTDAHAAAEARKAGLTLLDRRDYELPAGDPRRLVIFGV